MDLHGNQQASGTAEDMTLAALDFPAGVNAPWRCIRWS
jgi:hypothetical protein